MLYRALGYFCFLALLLLFSFPLPISGALAADDAVWSFSEANDPSNRGRMTARLRLGVPETDDVRVDGVCDVRGGPANLILGADIGKLAEGSAITVRFSGGGGEYSVPGIVFGTQIEEGITGVSLDIGVRDKIWTALTGQTALDYQVPGYASSKLSLKDGHGKIRQFIRACRDYNESAGGSKTAQKKTEANKAEQAKAEPKAKKPKADKKAASGGSAKEAFNSAKELGTIEAWEAFLETYPDGFRAALARAYVKRLGEGAGKPASPGAASKPVAAAPAPSLPPAPPAAPADISLAMTSQGACTGGQACAVNITATNSGGKPFTGELVLATSIAPGGATVESASPQPWFCQDMGGGAVCTNPSVTLAPGQSTAVLVALKLPRNTGGQITSCTSISWGGAPTASDARSVQQALNDAGFNAGRPDGRPGGKTRAAIRAYQQQNGLQITGRIDLPLLLAMFASPGAGDGDAINDQACAGSAVASAIPLPPPVPFGPICPPGQLVNRAGQCACPSSAPYWTGKSCLPRVTSNCKGGTYYNKRQKLCLCPARKPFWDGRRCKANAPLVAQPGVAGCPTGTVAVGNLCLNAAIAPIFQRRRGGGGGGGRGGPGGIAVLPGGGARQTGARPTTTTTQTGTGPGPGIATVGAKTCALNRPVVPGSCACPPGSVFSNKNKSCYVPTPQVKRPACPVNKLFDSRRNCDTASGVTCRTGFGVPNGKIICHKSGSPQEKAWVQKAGSASGSQQGAGGQTASGAKKCYPDILTGKQICNCPPAKIFFAASTGRTWCGKAEAVRKAYQAAQAKLKNNGCPKAKPIKTLKGQCISYAAARTTRCVDLGFPEAIAYRPNASCAPSTGGGLRAAPATGVAGGAKKCINNLVPLPNGRCGCPAGLPRLTGNRCIAALPNLINPNINQANRCVGGIRNTKGVCICPKAKPALVNGVCSVPARQTTQGSSGAKKQCYIDVVTFTKNCNCPPAKVFTYTDGNKYCGTLQQLKNTQNIFRAAAGATRNTGCPASAPFRKRGGGCVTAAQAKNLRCVDIGVPESASSWGGTVNRPCLPSTGAKKKTLAKPRPPAINCQPPARGAGGKCVCPAGQRVIESGRSGDGKTTFVITYGCTGAAAPAPQKTVTPKALPLCNPGRLYSLGQCRCAPGWTWTRKPRSAGFQCIKAPQAPTGAKDPFDCGDGRRKDNPTGRCLCPAGLSFVGGKCIRPQAVDTRTGQRQCNPGYARNPDNVSVCLPIATIQALQKQKKLRLEQQRRLANECVNNEIRLNNGKCGCPANLPRHLERRCYPAFRPQPATPPPTGCPPTHNKIGNRCVLKPPSTPRAAGCPGGMIRQPNGQCACPNWAHLKNGQCVRKPAPTRRTVCPANTTLVNGFCRAINPPEPPKCPPGKSPGPNGGCFVISDIRLKRDIAHITTRSDGLKLYSYRYLWDDKRHVGVMAQELLNDPARRHLVIRHPGGYYMVDYRALGLETGGQ